MGGSSLLVTGVLVISAKNINQYYPRTSEVIIRSVAVSRIIARPHRMLCVHTHTYRIVGLRDNSEPRLFPSILDCLKCVAVEERLSTQSSSILVSVGSTQYFILLGYLARKNLELWSPSCQSILLSLCPTQTIQSFQLVDIAGNREHAYATYYRSEG